ncbi:MFS transporter [Erysipelothrix urinaevulpis]|uniref:MFS transporter n=1 Tax=Erysipelothrix urinaevulpis TaxID=2683717 RepID=UPI00135A5DAA|nr:MFS transporter [Erysipelothrix urinaevulpis]
MNQFVSKHKMRIFIVFNLILTIGMNLGHPVTPSLLKSLDLAPHVFGISFAAMSATNFFFALIWSNLANGLKKTRILMISSIGYGLAQILFAFSPNEFTIYLARLLAGAFAGGFQVGLMSYIINEAKPEDQSRYITMSSIIISVGAALGFFIGGKIGDVSVLLTFIVQMILHVGMGLLFFYVLGREEKIEEHFEKEMLRDSNPFKVLSSSSEYWLGFTKYLFLSILVSSIAVTLYDQSFNYYIKDIFDFPPSVNGNVKAIVGVFAVLLNVLVIWRKRKKGSGTEAKLLPYLVLMMGAGAIYASTIDESNLFLQVSLAWFGLNTVMIPLQQNLVMTFKEDNESGNRLTGLYNALLMLGKILGALITSYVYSLNPASSFMVSGILLLLSTLFVFVLNIKVKN